MPSHIQTNLSGVTTALLNLIILKKGHVGPILGIQKGMEVAVLLGVWV